MIWSGLIANLLITVMNVMEQHFEWFTTESTLLYIAVTLMVHECLTDSKRK